MPVPPPLSNPPAAPDPLPRWKRALDLLAVVAALPLLGLGALVMLVLARLHSPGPILYRQQRIGLRGRPFELLKFRTMHVAAPATAHREHVAALITSNAPMQKLDAARDERLIRGSWLLRSSGLDELPQILNVLRGEMSLVGPRPCLPYEYERYTEPQRRRLDVLPGLTGLWQVSGKNHTTFQRMIELDLDYARRMSLAQDLRIIALTVPTVAGLVRESLRQRHQRHPPATAREHPPRETPLRKPPPREAPARESTLPSRSCNSPLHLS